jgi:hypothetical protein
VVTASGRQSPYAVVVTEPEGPPDLLYHYTGLEGLEGILRERMIWATDVRYLNDTSEVHYSREVIGRRAADRDEKLSETYGGFLAHGTAAGLGGSAMFPDTFVASFCEDGDNLTQWKTYGRGGYGFALGFDWESLRQLSQVSSYSLVPIIYDTVRQDERVDDVIDEAADQYAAWGGEISDLTSAKQVLLVTYALMVALWSIKHPSYADEREWRLVHMMFPLDPPPTPFFRDGRRGTTPYEKVPLNAVLGGFPLKEVVLGPCALDTRLQVEGGLAENGISGVLVRDSDVPFFG